MGTWAIPELGEEVAQTLLDAYRSVDMPNYNAWLNQLDDYSAHAMDDCTELAWQALKACRPPQENHRVMYNPVDESWRLSDTPIELYYPL
ncbi:hypothetical protein QNM99_27075 [Pseudomonas sp. PCH446]